jgi:hypothetical protein
MDARVKPAHDERVGAGFSRTGIGLSGSVDIVFAMVIVAGALYMLSRNLTPT